MQKLPEKYCLHCYEGKNIINESVVKEYFDTDLGNGWICQKCLDDCEKDFEQV